MKRSDSHLESDKKSPRDPKSPPHSDKDHDHDREREKLEEDKRNWDLHHPKNK